MKANFKKLAASAAVAGALAASSMSAHAVIQAVEGQAQLVPLFFHTAEGANTVVRVTVPKSVGLNTIIQMLNPGTSPTGAYESDGDADLSPVIINPYDLLQGGNNNQPLVSNGIAVGNAIDANLYPNSFIHWYFLDTNSRHVVNGRFPVSQDDVVVLNANCLGTSGAVPTSSGGHVIPPIGLTPGNECLILGERSAIPANMAGYLVLVNESARNGGAPLFSFTADAWVTNLTGPNNPNTRAIAPGAVSIPTLAMNDAADTTSFPTPDNQVIENQNLTGTIFYPVASPLTTGIKTGVLDPNRVIATVEVPLADRRFYINQVIVWNDRNGLLAQGEEVDQDENVCSFRANLPDQLNLIGVANHAYHSDDFVTQADVQSAFSVTYANPANPKSVFGAASTGYNDAADAAWLTDLCQSNGRDGMMKMYVSKPAAPEGATGPYASMMAFTIPLAIGDEFIETPFADQTPLVPTLLAKERGWFSGR